MTIPVAHDFICPWCWVGLIQSKRLTEEFGVEFDWLGYELYPDEIPWPEPKPKAPEPANRPTTPSRFELLLAAESMELPKVERPKQMRVRNALMAVEFAKEHGVADEFVESLYRAYWEDGLNISDPGVLDPLAKGLGLASTELLSAIADGRYRGRLVGFDKEAYSVGIYNVPTFFIGGERYAEQPYRVLREAVVRATKEVA